MRFGNPLTRRIAGRLPWFCIISYVGRTSGRRYRTPMNVFRDGEDYIFALTYGGDVQWVKNVLAAGEADIETMGRTVALRDPRPFVDPGRRLMPLPVRFFLGLIRVSEFLRMSPAQPG
ncbi:MAG: nitroreductase family deazaflavin-dependent oxidoreductase [Candidatus Limnocylindrales bacterium]